MNPKLCACASIGVIYCVQWIHRVAGIPFRSGEPLRPKPGQSTTGKATAHEIDFDCLILIGRFEFASVYPTYGIINATLILCKSCLFQTWVQLTISPLAYKLSLELFLHKCMTPFSSIVALVVYAFINYISQLGEHTSKLVNVITPWQTTRRIDPVQLIN